MPSRLQSVVSFGIPSTAAVTVVVAALLSPGGPGAPKPHDLVHQWDEPTEPGTHAIDVVFAVDTTGSMDKLIEGAKRTVWSIATHIRDTDPNASLRIGLVAYRDQGDDYVTRPFALTNDLDAVYRELTTYEASGGGDPPEDVAAAMRDALAMRWRAGAKKLVFVVGDAPPGARDDAPPYDQLAREAGTSGIIINTIRCGSDPTTALAFQRIASLGSGEFSTIAQDGGVQQVATPYDERLGELSTTIDRTAVIAGEAERAAHAANVEAAAAAPAPAKADRASYYAKGAKYGKASRADADLVGKLEAGVDISTVPATELPAEMRTKTAPEIKAELARRVEARKAAQKEAEELTRKRDEYLSKHKTGGGGFDDAVKATVEKQIK